LASAHKSSGNRLAVRDFLTAVAALIFALSTPLLAQSDFTGKYRKLNHWDAAKRGGGPEIGDYTGLPLNDAARMRADSWEASEFTIPEYQCRPHTGPYSERGFSGTTLKWWAEIDPRTQKIVAWRTRGGFEEPERWIYMDGRPHPPEYAAHTWFGFSTGKWEGSTLVVQTTHLKEGYTERNGVAQSDRATVTENWVRHGQYLNQITIIEDPVYLTEPLVRSTAWVLDDKLEFYRSPCAPQEVVVEVVRTSTQIPHILPGMNKGLTEFPIRYGIPYEAVRGHAEALYPEYREKLKTLKPASKEAPSSIPAKGKER
jgi:hypothetical protein